MKRFLYIVECICLFMAILGICLFDSNYIVGSALFVIFGGALAYCAWKDNQYY